MKDIEHFPDGTFQIFSSTATTRLEPREGTFVVSHDRNNFVFTSGRQLFVFINGQRLYLESTVPRYGPHKYTNNAVIYIVVNTRRFVFRNESYNWIDCYNHELLLLSNGYFMIFDKQGRMVHSSSTEVDWSQNIPLWFTNVTLETVTL